VVLNARVTNVDVSGGRFEISTQDSTTGQQQPPLEATHVFSTLPAYRLAPLVQASLPRLSESLASIQFVDMGTVHVGYNRAVLQSDGFGYLIPSCEKQRVLGVIFDSNAFPSQNTSALQTRLSVVCGGAHFPQIASLSESDLTGIALDAASRHLGIADAPDFVRALVLPKAIPQYHVGFHATLQTIESQLVPGLQLGGNSFYGVGLADCVTRSKQLALEFAQQIGQR
jgi:protoporphyrinogen/coproporphyrinogen III oxidase